MWHFGNEGSQVSFKCPILITFCAGLLVCSWRSWRSARTSSTALGIPVKRTKTRRGTRLVWRESPVGRVRRAFNFWETCKVYSPPFRRMTSVGTADLSSPCGGWFLRGLYLLLFWLQQPNQLPCWMKDNIRVAPSKQRLLLFYLYAWSCYPREGSWGWVEREREREKISRLLLFHC